MANMALLCGLTALGLERVPAVGLAPIHVRSSNALGSFLMDQVYLIDHIWRWRSRSGRPPSSFSLAS